jgi:hypothetical protein
MKPSKKKGLADAIAEVMSEESERMLRAQEHLKESERLRADKTDTDSQAETP